MTKFLLIWIRNQLAEKIYNSSIDTSHSARNLGFIFDEHITFSDQIITFVNFAVSGLTSNRQLPVLLLSLSFTPNLITAIISTINSISLNYSVSSRPRNILLVLSLKLQSHVISLLYYALFTGWGSLNASNTSSSHLSTNFSKLLDLRTFITSSLLNVLVVLALHPSLPLLGHRHHPL